MNTRRFLTLFSVRVAVSIPRRPPRSVLGELIPSHSPFRGRFRPPLSSEPFLVKQISRLRAAGPRQCAAARTPSPAAVGRLRGYHPRTGLTLARAGRRSGTRHQPGSSSPFLSNLPLFLARLRTRPLPTAPSSAAASVAASSQPRALPNTGRAAVPAQLRHQRLVRCRRGRRSTAASHPRQITSPVDGARGPQPLPLAGRPPVPPLGPVPTCPCSALALITVLPAPPQPAATLCLRLPQPRQRSRSRTSAPSTGRPRSSDESLGDGCVSPPPPPRARFGSPLCRPMAGPRPGPRGTRHGLPRLPRAPPPAPRAVPFPSAAPAAPWAAVTRQSVTGANDRLITGLPGQHASPAAFGYRHGVTAPAKPAQRSHRDLHPAAAAAVPGRGIAPGVGFTSRLLQRRG